MVKGFHDKNSILKNRKWKRNYHHVSHIRISLHPAVLFLFLLHFLIRCLLFLCLLSKEIHSFLYKRQQLLAIKTFQNWWADFRKEMIWPSFAGWPIVWSPVVKCDNRQNACIFEAGNCRVSWFTTVLRKMLKLPNVVGFWGGRAM